jgi:hypothetical protein
MLIQQPGSLDERQLEAAEMIADSSVSFRR